MPRPAMNIPPGHSRHIREDLAWRRRIHVASAGASVAAITVFGSLMLTSYQEASAASQVVAAAVPASVRSDSTPAPANPNDMPGMDMSGMDMSGGTSTPGTTMAPDMPGMDMGGNTPAPTSSGDMPGMEMPGMDHEHGAAGPAAHRPLAPVLGTFGGGSAAVLLTAGMLRRKDRAASLAKKAARIAGRAGK